MDGLLRTGEAKSLQFEDEPEVELSGEAAGEKCVNWNTID